MPMRGLRPRDARTSAPLYRSEREIFFRTESSSPLRTIDVGARPVENLSRLHHRLRQGRMGMNGQSDVLSQRRHFNRKHTFGDEFSRSCADDADAEYPLRVRVEDELGHAFGTI